MKGVVPLKANKFLEVIMQQITKKVKKESDTHSSPLPWESDGGSRAAAFFISVLIIIDERMTS